MYIIKPEIKGIFDRTLGYDPWAPPGVSLIAARRMWPTTRGEGIVVAVLDTGIDYQHPDLVTSVIGGKSFISNEKDYMDENGHGTHVAGIIAANGAILGVAPRAKLLAVKVLNKDGAGSMFSINQGLDWARDWKGPNGEKVNVINMSLGTSVADKSLHQHIIKAVNAGITVVCAAGNAGDSNPNTPEISYPAYFPETIAVGAIDLQTGIAGFSNSNDRIDVVAPGVDTYSTYPNSKYVKLSGTSMATPHISGAIALIYSRYKIRFKQMPLPAIVKSFMHYQAVDLGGMGFDTLYGFGLFSFNLDGGKAIKLIVGQKKYFVNTKQCSLNTAPVLKEGQPVADVLEIAELLSSDAILIPADGSQDNMQGQLEIWS